MHFSLLWVEKLVQKGKTLAKPSGIWLRYVHYSKHLYYVDSSKASWMHMSGLKTATPCRTCWFLEIVSVKRKWSWVNFHLGSLCPDPSIMTSYDWNAIFPKTVIKVRQEERKRKQTINTVLPHYLRREHSVFTMTDSVYLNYITPINFKWAIFYIAFYLSAEGL